MMKKLLTSIFAGLLTANLWATGFDVKTSSIMDQPGTEVLGDYKGSWYVIGFQEAGTLNRPPQYKIFKYAPGFKTGKISALYPSFGEKTLYIKSTFVNNKISMFYAKCGKREDVNILLDKRDDHRQLPVIMRQDYDPNTLEPVGEPTLVFDEENEYFSPCAMEISQSPDRSKTALLFKPYYKHQKYKVTICDNNTGNVFSKTFDFKLTKEYWKFLNMAVNNNGTVLFDTKLRDDVITLNQSGNAKGQVKYYLISVNKSSGEKPASTEMVSNAAGNYFRNPSIAALNSGEMVVVCDVYASDKDPALRSVSVTKYNDNLTATGKQEISPDPQFAAQAGKYHPFRKGREFTHLETQQILPLAGNNFLVVTEYHDTLPNTDKTQPVKTERNYIIAFRFNEGMSVTDQQFIPKKQISSTVGYAFSTRAFAKGNDAYVFYNADWEADEEHNMNLQCTRLAAEGGEPQTTKVLNTSNDFYTSMEHVFPGNDGKLLLTVERAVDYEDVSREVKLLEIAPR